MASNETTVAARTLYFQGRTAEAESLFREAVGERPDDLDALEGLGTLILERGRAGEAVGLFRRGLAIRPDSPDLHAHLGEALRSLGRLNEAMAHLRRATELDPSLAQAWNSLGLLASARGHHDYAEVAHREAMRLRPDYIAPRINLANTLLARGRLNEAVDELRRVLDQEPSQGAAMLNLGRILVELRDPDRLDEAEALSRRAVEFLPGLPHAWSNLAHVLRVRGKLDEATACEQQARAAAGRGSMAGGAAPESGRPAGKSGDVPAGQGPAREAEAHHARGLAALTDGRTDDAEVYFREAVRLDPTRGDSWLRLARIEQERGAFELCSESARAALTAEPRLAAAYGLLASLLRGQLPDSDLDAMRGMLGDPQVSPESRALLRFGLAAVLDHRGQFAEAAAHLEAANALQGAWKAARGLTFDAERADAFVERIVAGFTPEFLARRRGWGDPDPRPVFIVGLPRSGTTLTEQILASHPRVHGAGERHDVMMAFLSLPERVGLPGADPLHVLERLTPESTRAAARGYIERLDELAPPTASRVVDKQPDNIDLLGLIALLWPGARVIVCRRDLRDVALSCWQMGFATNPWCNDWERIARRFAIHQRVMEHWRQTRPIAWLELSYEALVTELEGQARRMIAFLGLEWDPSCLEFHANRRVVRTPSLVQVRQPVHTRSVGRWRNYESVMQPVLRAFERYGVIPETS